MAVKVNEYAQGKARLLEVFKVKGFKTWRGREGVGAQATVYKDGKQIGWVTDEGNGGEVTFDAINKSFWDVKAILDTLPKYEFKDYCNRHISDRYDTGDDEVWDGEPKRPWVMHVFADVMLEQAEEENQLKKICKTKILVRYEGEKGFREFHAKWPKDTYGQMMIMSQLIKQVQPNVIAEFINKRFD